MQSGKNAVRFLLMLLGVMLVSAGAMMTEAFAAGNKSSPPLPPVLVVVPDKYKADELLVKYKPTVSDVDRKITAERLGARSVRHFKGHAKLPKNRSEQWSHVKFRQGEDLQKAMARFKQDPAVEYVEPNYIVTTTAVPNDPRFSELWGMNNTGQSGGTPNADINAPEAWDLATGDGNTIVAVIDTGVDYNHPDLKANMWVNPGEIPDNGIDDDGNGFVDDVYGYDFFSNVGNPMDDYGHGTHVAGTIAAVGDNGIGVAGVNWHAKIMALKFIGGGGYGTTDGAISSIYYAIQMGAKIFSNSWGGSGYSQALYDAIQAAGDAGVLFVAAAGNSGCDCMLYPAAYDLPNIISVAATDRNDALASFSNYDVGAVDLGAPGVSILSTLPDYWVASGLYNPSGYGLLSGTSMATPHVSGAAALLKSAVPSVTWQEIKAQILASVDPIPALDGKTVSGGRLNVQQMLGNLKFMTDISPGGQSVLAGNSATYTVTFKSENHYGGTLNLSLTSPDSGITGVFANPAVTLPVDGTASTTITLSTTPAVLQAIYHLSLNVTDPQGASLLNKHFDLTVSPDVDLVMTNVSTTAPSFPIGNTATVSTTIKNQASVAATASTTIGIYLSSDTKISAADTLIGTRTVPPLAAGESSTANTTITVPFGYPQGTYYLGAIADMNNQQLEMSETNNALTGAATQVMPDVDLVMTAVGATFLPYDGDSYVNYTMKNQGHTHTLLGSVDYWFNLPNPLVGIYLSTDPIITRDDLLIGYGLGTPNGYSGPSGLAPGASYSDRAFVQLPSTLVPNGTYYLGAIADYSDVEAESDETNNALTGAAMTIVRDVDLVVTAVSTPAGSLSTTEQVLGSVTVKNQGTTPSMPVSVTIYLSTDQTITTADQRIGQETIFRLAAGESVTIPPSLNIPFDFAPGTYYLGAIVDADNAQVESNETNNAFTGAPVTVYVGGDLVMTAVSTTAAWLPINSAVTISTTIKNQGTARTVAMSGVGIYLSTDATITAADTLIGSADTYPLAAGASATVSSQVSIPANLAPGTYYLGAIADYSGLEPEGNETNNALTGAAINVASDIDLVTTNVSTTATSLLESDTAPISVTVKNQGTSGTIGPVSVGIYLSKDATITTADTLLGNLTAGANWGVLAGTSETIATGFWIPSDLTPGTYYLGAIADNNNTQSETNETNNALTGAAITVVSNVDLVMTAVSTTETSLSTGSTATVYTNVQNLGGGPTAANSTVGIYLSPDATITTADTLIGTTTVGTLAGGANWNANTTVNIPPGMAEGTYYLGAIANIGNTQSETNVTNNAFTGVAIPVARNVDLVMSGVTTTAANLPIGGTAPVSTRVHNQGVSPTTASSTIGIYLSTDSTITTADTLVGTVTVPSLAAGASSTFNTTMNIPSTLPAGSYYLGAIADYTNTQPETNETNNALAWTRQSVVSSVDLVMTAVSTTATSLTAGSTATVSTTVMNAGPSPTTASSTVGIYLSTDATITTADTLVGTTTVATLAGGASLPVNTTVAIPSGLAAGTYYLGAIADTGSTQTETDETNNALAGAAIPVLANVDLVMTAVSTTATSLPIGGTAPVTATVKNQGINATTASSIVGIYLSTDATITGADTLVGTATVSSLAAGASSPVSATVTIPSNLAAGTYYLGAIADYTNTQVETIETNNALAGATIPVVSSVDLVMTAVSTTAANLPIGGTVTVSNTVKNQGVSPTTASSTIGIYVSTDATITTADTLVGTRVISSLAGGASSAVDTIVTIPSTLTAGTTYYLGAIADYTNTQTETIETNNALAAAGKTALRNVDLVMSALSTTATSMTIGGTATVSNTELNQGTASTTASNTVGIYLSTDATITTADTLIGSRSVATALAAGATSPASTTVTIPSTMAAGTYYMGAIADTGSTQTETNEANNTLVASTTVVVVPNVDLVMTAVSTTATSAKVGTTISVSNTEKNQGTKATTASNNVGFYLSTDATITTADTLIGSRAVASLAAAATSVASTTVTIPLTMAPGTYYLGVLADKDNGQPETIETNNALTKTGTITITP